MKRARQLLRHPPGPPYQGAVAIINAMLREILADLGYETSCVSRLRNVNSDISDWVPLPAARAVHRMQSDPVDLEIRDNTSLHFFPPSHRGARRNVLFLHALLSPGEQWFGNDFIDRYWANSEYLARLLVSFLSLPDWGRGRLFDPRAFSIVSSVTLPLPLLEMPEALIEHGSGELPAAALAAMESDDLLGHCVTGKLDQRATYAILLGLNQMALRGGIGRRFRLFVESWLYDDLRRLLQDMPLADMPPEFRPLRAYLAHLGLTIDDILIPIPLLAQSASFAILRACHFGLQYHWLPEAFGLFPLESICHGCPIYTNGAGNLRYLLPADCGINVVETEDMVFGDPAAYLPVVERIFQDTVVNPAPAREACRRGAEHIAARYTKKALRRDLEARLGELDAPLSEHGLDAARIVLSPLVRSWNPETRRIISDRQSLELPPESAGLLHEILGQRCGDLDCRRSAAAMAAVDGLFDQGIIAAFPAA